MIEFLKRWSLPVAVAQICRKQKAFRSSHSYRDAARILIVFTMEGNEKVQQVRDLQASFESDGKEVSILYYLPKPDLAPDVHLDQGMERIEQRHIGFFGSIDHEKARQMLRTEFDFLVHADLNTSTSINLMLCMSKARCRIGRHFDGREGFYELMIEPGSDDQLSGFYRDLYTYTKAL